MRTGLSFVVVILFALTAGGNVYTAEQAGAASKSSEGAAVGSEMLQWDPMEEMEMMQGKINRIFRESFRRARQEEKMLMRGEGEAFRPAVNVTETASEYHVSVDLPGVKKKDINVELKDHDLTITGRRESKKKTENQKVIKQEQSYGYFYTELTLPEYVNVAEVNAEYRNGVLDISMPLRKIEKKPEAATRKIQVL